MLTVEDEATTFEVNPLGNRQRLRPRDSFIARNARQTRPILVEEPSMAIDDSMLIQETVDESLSEVEIDEVKTRQVLVNLLVNAIKFSPERSTVTIVTRADSGFIVVEIIDSGPGIAPDETAHIFELFGQGLRAGDGQTSGLGIGLHLVKRITELHGGHVGVISVPGEGSTFWVRLPDAELSSRPVPQAA